MAGLATPSRPKRVVKNVLAFERRGGLAMSTEDREHKWIFPYGWGNIEMLSVEGLRRYGYNTDADRISMNFSRGGGKFSSRWLYRRKVQCGHPLLRCHAELGYKMNVVGFRLDQRRISRTVARLTEGSGGPVGCGTRPAPCLRRSDQ